VIFKEPKVAARQVAAEIATLIREREQEGRFAVLGLATGSTPIFVYQELVRLHREEGLSFANVITFNLDEYYPISPDQAQSYHHFMRQHLFDHVDLDPKRTHLPDGTVPRAEAAAACAEYEELITRAGGIDFQLLGIGRTGHIGFNEPGSARRSGTRFIHLDRVTRQDAIKDFQNEESVPRTAITMGVRTILAARRIVLMAFGEHKAGIIARTVEGEIDAEVPATFLQDHENTLLVLDESAAGELTRLRTPWVVGSLEEMDLAWNDAMVRRAVTWLTRIIIRTRCRTSSLRAATPTSSTCASSASSRTPSPAGPAASPAQPSSRRRCARRRRQSSPSASSFSPRIRAMARGRSAARSRGSPSRATRCTSSIRFPAAARCATRWSTVTPIFSSTCG
jgi:glucosamine-6-phosphate deaminase